MNKLHVYEVCYPDGYQEICFIPNEEVLEAGGVPAIESDLRENAAWFYPIGKITGSPDERGDLCLELRPIVGLVAAWKERGSPKMRGTATSTKAEFTIEPSRKITRPQASIQGLLPKLRIDLVD